MEIERSKLKKSQRKSKEPKEVKEQVVTKKALTVQDGNESELTGIAIYFLRTSTKRTLGLVYIMLYVFLFKIYSF